MTAEQNQISGQYVDKLSQSERGDILFQERSLLGTLFASPEAFPETSDFLKPIHFYDGFHGRVFEQFMLLWGRGDFSYPRLTQSLIGDKTAESLDVSVSAYLASLANHSCIPFEARSLAKAVYENWYRLEAAKQADYNAQLAKETGEFAVSEPPALSPNDIDVKPGHRVEDQKSPFERVSTEVNDAYRDGVVPDRFMSTQLTDLDRKITGFMRGRYYSIAGRPAMGKTTVATSIMINLARKGHGCAYFSLEMTSEEIAARCMSDVCKRMGHVIPYKDVERLEGLSEAQVEALCKAGEIIDTKLPMHVDDAAGLTIHDIEMKAVQRRAEMSRKGQKLDVILIDHMGLIKPSDRNSNKVAEVEAVSNALKVLAKNLDVAVVSLVQLNRGTEGREDKRPTLADLRWSGAIEQDSDVVMFVYREAYYHGLKGDTIAENDTRNELELIIAKNRSGDTGPVKLYVETPCAFVGNLEGNR